MTNLALKESYQSFSELAAPYLHISDNESYEQALELIEELFEEVEDNNNDHFNGLISLLGQAIAHYEEGIEALEIFEKQSDDQAADIVMLRVLIEQHQLGVASFPEIGDKSHISRILSGERNLTKRHIALLSKRFNINPSLFF